MKNRIEAIQKKYKTLVSMKAVPSNLLTLYGPLYFIRAVDDGFIALFRRSDILQSNIVFLSDDLTRYNLILQEAAYIMTMDVDIETETIFYAVANIVDLPKDKNKALIDRGNSIKSVKFDGTENTVFVSSSNDAGIFPTYLYLAAQKIYFYDYISSNLFVYDLKGNQLRSILLENQFISEISVDEGCDTIYALSFSDLNTLAVTTGCNYRRIFEIAADDSVAVFYQENITNDTYSLVASGEHVYISDIKFIYKLSTDKDIVFRGKVSQLLAFNNIDIESVSLLRLTPSVSDKNIFYGIVHSKGNYFVATMTV